MKQKGWWNRTVFGLLLVGSAVVFAHAPSAIAAEQRQSRDAICTKCHDETESKPILAIYQTPHGVSGDARTSGAVCLSTLHGAKGLEFPVVLLAGVNSGDLPLERKNAILDTAEERRLFYVGLTRAREELIVSCGGEPSPFLSDFTRT